MKGKPTKYLSQLKNKVYILAWFQIHVDIIGIPVFLRKIVHYDLVVNSLVSQNGFQIDKIKHNKRIVRTKRVC